MKKTFYFFTFILIYFSSCKKDYPDSVSNAPVFSFSGTVNNSRINLQAGLNNYYMYSFFTQDSNNVYNFIAELKQNNCSNCNNKIRIQINDNAVSASGGISHIHSAISSGTYSFQSSDTSMLTINFASPTSGSVQSTYSWDFGDSSISSLANPIHTYIQAGAYTVCLTIHDNTSCSSTICNVINVGNINSSCTTTFTDTLLGGMVNTFSFVANGSPSSIFMWDFGDGSPIDTASSNTVNHGYSATGIYRVCLTTTTAAPGNCVSTYCRNVATNSFVGCYSNYSFTIPSLNPNPFSLSDILISWTDNSGITYTSNSIVQPVSSYFQIVSVENYLNNERNEPTKKLHVKFKCVLSDGLNSISVNDGDAVIAVSYR